MANFLGSPSPEINHRLLALDGPTLYYQTNLGAVVAARRRGRRHPLDGHLSVAGRGRLGRAAGPRPQPGGRPRRPGDRRARRHAVDLRLRRGVGPDGLEDAARARGPARPPARCRQGEGRRHRRPRAALRREDRPAEARLAPERPDPAGLRSWVTGGRQDLLADQDRDPHPGPGDRRAGRPPDQAPAVPGDRRQPGGRRRLSRRRRCRIDGRLLPEPPAHGALPRRDRPGARQGDELLPARPDGRGRRHRRRGARQLRAGDPPRPAERDDRRDDARRVGPRPPEPPPDEAGGRGAEGERPGAGHGQIRPSGRGRPGRPRPARRQARAGGGRARRGQAGRRRGDPPDPPRRRAAPAADRARRGRPPLGPRRPAHRRPPDGHRPRERPDRLCRVRPRGRGPAGARDQGARRPAPRGRRPELPGVEGHARRIAGPRPAP